jgi:signal recognition particle receptor subunit beta
VAQPYSQPREVHLKLVFFGPAAAGKTSALNYLYRVLRPDVRGQLVSVNTGTDRTLFFDFYPAPPPKLLGVTIHVQIYAAAGSVQNDATRRALLAGVDGVLFIADSRKGRERDNIQALEELRNCLLELNLKLAEVPLVLAWNKRDVPESLSVGELEAGLNITQAPSFAMVAHVGQGVFEAFRALASKALDTTLKRRPELLPSTYGQRLEAAYASDMATSRRLLATQEAQRALMVLANRYATDASPKHSERSSRPSPSEPPSAPSPSLSPASLAAAAMPSASSPAPGVAPSSVAPARLPPSVLESSQARSGPAPSSVPSPEGYGGDGAGSGDQPVEPTIPMHVMPVRGDVQVHDEPLLSRRPSAPPRVRVEPSSEAPPGGISTNAAASPAPTASAASRPQHPSRPAMLAASGRSDGGREVFMSQLLPPGSMRTQLLDVERLLHAGQFTPAVRRAAGIFYALTAADATREPDEGPAWRGLVLGLPVDRYLRFRQAVQDAESGKSTAEDGLFALFFLLDAILRKEAGLARAT